MNVKDEKRRNIILNGNLWVVIFSVCFPLFIYNFFDSLYNFIDTIMVSNISTDSVSSVASISQIKGLFSSVGAGLAGGGGILIARSFGANDIEKGEKIVNNLTTLGMIVLIMLLLCIPFAQPILAICGCPKEYIGIGTGYFIVQLINLGVIIYNSIFIAIQKAKGDTKPIFYFNILAMIVKLSLTALFIFVFHVDNTIYVAIATLISQLVLFFILFSMMNKKDSLYKVHLFKFSLNKKIAWEIIVISLPIFFGKFVFNFGKVAVNAMCNVYGPLTVGALAVSNHICGLVTSPMNSLEEGGSTIVSQNLGNNNIKRALKSFTYLFILAIIMGLGFYLLIQFVLQGVLIDVFSMTKPVGDENRELFLKTIKDINNYDNLSILALGINAAVLGVLYGFKQTKLCMIINISRVFVFRVPVLWFLQTFHKEMGAECAGISMGISNILICITSLVVLAIFLLSLKNKEKKEKLLIIGESKKDIQVIEKNVAPMVNVGINLKKGQEVVIYISIKQNKKGKLLIIRRS